MIRCFEKLEAPRLEWRYVGVFTSDMEHGTNRTFNIQIFLVRLDDRISFFVTFYCVSEDYFRLEPNITSIPNTLTWFIL